MVAGDRLAAIAADRPLLRRLACWAVVNWLLDAVSLWCFLAVFGHAPGIDGLLVAFGVANVLAAVPISPGGAGVVEWAYLTTLPSFGLSAAAVSLGVVAYRGAQALLPTVVGGICYVSLVRGPWAVTAPRATASGDRRRRSGDGLRGGYLAETGVGSTTPGSGTVRATAASTPRHGWARDVTAPRLPVPSPRRWRRRQRPRASRHRIVRDQHSRCRWRVTIRRRSVVRCSRSCHCEGAPTI